MRARGDDPQLTEESESVWNRGHSISGTDRGRRDLTAMRNTMRHRGPDDEAEWWADDGRVGLGHRRLAIIDLASTGHQPMSDASGGNWIVYNGEIYNYRELRCDLEGRGHSFRSRSDTEVVLEAYRAWGMDCLDYFSGMFAFALFDVKERRLFLARDRAGEKPLFLNAFALAGENNGNEKTNDPTYRATFLSTL